MDFKIAVLAGDGIGPEISVQGVDVMSAVCEKFGHKVSYEYAICGADAIDKVGDPFPEETYQVCKNADAVLFSAVGDPKFDNDPTAKVRPEQGLLAMRKKLGLFANIRPVQTFKCLIHKSPLRAELVENADFICIRELTGGMYFGEKYQDNDKAYDTNYYTRPEIERILKVAFEYAMKRRKHLTVVDKANVLASSRLWRQIAQEMAPNYPEVTTDYMFVDNAAMKMIQEPAFFDVMVTENTFGDILTDEGSVISGSMGLLPSASTGESTPVFEPIHGSWPQAKGLNIANPLAQILSVAMLFEYFDCKEEGALIRKAVAFGFAGEFFRSHAHHLAHLLGGSGAYASYNLAEGSVELSDLTGDFVGAVAFVEFEVGGALEEFAHALMLLNAGEFEKNLAVVVLKHLDVGGNHAVGVDTRTEHVGGGVVDAILDLGLEDGGDILVALALLHDGVEHHGVVGAGIKGAVLLDDVIC